MISKQGPRHGLKHARRQSQVHLINVEHNRSMLGHHALARLKRWCGCNRVQTCMNRAQRRKCAALFPFHPLRYMVDFKIKKLARLLLASLKFKKNRTETH